jgi:hypothetical protein
VLVRERVELAHVWCLAEQVNRDQRARLRGHRGTGAVEFEQVARVGVAEHRPRPRAHDARCRGDERQRRHQHLIARADAECTQREEQRVGARAHRNRAGAPQPLGERILEREHLLPLQCLPAAQHVRHALEQLIAMSRELALGGEERDRTGGRAQRLRARVHAGTGSAAAR